MMTMNGVEKSGLFSLPEYSGRRATMDQESYGYGSSEVEKWKGMRSSYNKLQAHSQIMRIRAEDSHLGEDKFGVAHFMLFSRPTILPASPLSGKTAH